MVIGLVVIDAVVHPSTTFTTKVTIEYPYPVICPFKSRVYTPTLEVLVVNTDIVVPVRVNMESAVELVPDVNNEYVIEGHKVSLLVKAAVPSVEDDPFHML